MRARIHDLLEIDAAEFLHAHPLAPQWVAESLRQAPFVVVRRGPTPVPEIAIGVRGAQRNERWAATCHPDRVGSVLTPQKLRTRIVPTSRSEAIPALRSLAFLAERWKDRDIQWGPGGSVGFELASGRPVVRAESDLDIVIYADTPMTQNEARDLRDCAQSLPALVDIRVETPICGFSLLEFASCRAPAPILLRIASGTVLGADPWNPVEGRP
jgi:phosphoribosyl-dephospho-CoA transferase